MIESSAPSFIEMKRRCPDYGPQIEVLVSLIYHEYVRPGDTVIDGGANAGLHSVPLAKLIGSNGNIYCFEPIPRIYANLQKGLTDSKLIQRAHLFCAALGAKEGVAEFLVDDSNHALSHIRRRKEGTPVVETGTKSVQVSVTTIDSVLASKQVRFIKLDLEGYDFLGICGAQKTISLSRPLIIFENSRNFAAKCYDYTKDEFFSFFQDLRYVIYDLHGRMLTRADWEDANYGFEFFAADSQDEMISKIIEIIRCFWNSTADRVQLSVWRDCVKAVRDPFSYVGRG